MTSNVSVVVVVISTFLLSWKLKIHTHILILLCHITYLIRFKIFAFLLSLVDLVAWLPWLSHGDSGQRRLHGQGHSAHCSVFLISRWAQCLPDFPMSWPLLSPSMVTPRWAPRPLWGYSDSIWSLLWWSAVQWWAFMTNYWAGNEKYDLWIQYFCMQVVDI